MYALQSTLDDRDNSSLAEIWVLDENGNEAWEEEENHAVLRFKNGMWFTYWKDTQKFICADMAAPYDDRSVLNEGRRQPGRLWVVQEHDIAGLYLLEQCIRIWCEDLAVDLGGSGPQRRAVAV